jgi:DNA-binding NtrC family response regulator
MPDTLIGTARRTPAFAQPNPLATELAGSSAAISRVQEMVRRVAALDGHVLLIARRGSDADAVARDIHARSPLGAHAFVSVACGAAGVEQVLFGDPVHPAPPDLEALSADSRVAAARGGTLFLEDATELPAGVQARLARLTRDGEARIDGEPVPTAMRLIVSAPPGIDSDVREHRFRSDVYRRVSTLRVDLPPLSERPEDVPVLALRVLEDLSTASGGRPRSFSQAALSLLGAMAWPGNLAELRETVERAASGTDQDPIQIEHLLPTLQLDRAPQVFAPEGTLRVARQRFEHDYIAAVLQHHGWRMTKAAQTLGIQRPNLYRKARQLGIPLVRSAEPEPRKY